MTPVTSHFVHFLVRRDLGRGYGWYTPYELDDDDTEGAGLAIPVDAEGKPFEEYWLDVRLTDGKGQEDLAYIVRLMSDGNLQLEMTVADFPFQERKVSPAQKCLQYRGRLHHPDFAYKLMEIEPVKDDIYDQILNNKEVTIIGCDPFKYYTDANGDPIK